MVYDMGKNTAAKMAAVNRYNQKNYVKITLRVRNDTEPTRDTISAAAAEAGESLNEFILNAIKQRLNGGEDPEGIEEIQREPFYE